jgi:hypothetical protein
MVRAMAPTYMYIRAHTDNTDLSSRLNQAGAEKVPKTAGQGNPSILSPNFTHFHNPFIFCIAAQTASPRSSSDQEQAILLDSHSGHTLTSPDSWKDLDILPVYW